ncbi:hypothetical protein O971_12385 [Mycobacterium avium subsp. hominissuis 10-4249]|nr:hypothetical protein O971_12385 [Mycobacterium avium subsp. hominissuis 10-4249]KDO96335.1 hypothetical protein MAVA5_11560 [Mycobacterium avium subsp. hominissuis A5]
MAVSRMCEVPCSMTYPPLRRPAIITSVPLVEILVIIFILY